MKAAPAATMTIGDLSVFDKIRVPPELLEEAGIRRVTNREARDEFGFHFNGDLDGLLFPYFTPAGDRVNARIRRDHPDIENGKPKNKYISAIYDHRRFYYPPGCQGMLADTDIPIVLVEAEKSVLAIWALLTRTGIPMLPIGIGGHSGWRGKIGKAQAEDGSRVDEKGPLPDFDHIVWTGRKVVINLDVNVATNPAVQAGEQRLLRELQKRGADVYCARIPQEAGVNGPDDYLGKHTDPDFLRLLDDAARQAWPEPRPIKASLRPVAQLPPALIPAPFRSWLTDISERMGCPLDFVAGPAIVVTATVVGAGCGIYPKRQDDWLCVPNLWGGVCGRPGIMLKSPALQETMRPLERLACEAREDYERSLKNYEADVEMVKARKEAARGLMKAAASGKKKKDSDDAIDPEYAKLAFKNIEEPPPPKQKRFKTSDATVEKLGELLRDNPRGLLAFRDELMGLFAGWDRDGREGDRAFFLEAWNGTGGHETDRIGRGSIHIQNACISILGGIQPAKLTSYLYSSMRGADNDGFVQRLQILVYPDEPPAGKLIDRYPNTEAKNRAYAIIRSLAEADFLKLGAHAPEGGEGIPYFRFDNEAQELFYLWFDDLSQRVRRDSEEPIVAEHLIKYRSLMPSLALLFHLIDVVDGAVTPGPIPAITAKRAMAWCDFLESHARRIYALVTDIRIEAAARLARKIESGDLVDGFTARDVYRKCWGLLDQKDVVEGAIDELVSRGWLREQDPVLTRGRSRLTEYLINPRVTSVSSVSATPAHIEEEK